MEKEKLGIYLIALGIALYVAYLFFGSGNNSAVGDFSSGILLGLSIGINLVGIILTIIYYSKK